MRSLRIALVGDFKPTATSHQAIPQALRMASAPAGLAIEPVWIGTATLGPAVSIQLADFAAIWCVPAGPYANAEGALRAIRFARESGRPFLGTCAGFQYALLEFAQNVLGYRHAEHVREQPASPMPWITPLACTLIERSATLNLLEGSQLREIYGLPQAEEHYHCRYGLNPEYERLLEGSALCLSGRDEAGEVRAVELSGHPLFIATLFQPERAALRGIPHPLVDAYVAAAVSRMSVV